MAKGKLERWLMIMLRTLCSTVDDNTRQHQKRITEPAGKNKLLL